MSKVTESEFQETVNLIKAANLMRVKNVVERMFQELTELKQELTELKQQIQEKKNAEPSSNTKPTK